MNKLIKCFLLLLSCATFISCNNLFQNDDNQEDSEKIILTGLIDLDDSARKAIPGNYSLYEELTYKLSATCNTDKNYSIVNKGVETNSITMELIKGNWSFELTAYSGETAILRSSENSNIEITEDTELSFKMKGISNGTLVYNFILQSSEETELDINSNPVLKFQAYKYNGSVQNTLNSEPVFLAEDNFSNLVKEEQIPTLVGKELVTYTEFSRKVVFTLEEGTYIVVCKKAIRYEGIDEDTVTSDQLSFFFQELVEVKSGLTTESKINKAGDFKVEHKITLHTNGGTFSGYSLTTVEENNCYEYSYDGANEFRILSEPTKAGNVFNGWFYDEECTIPAVNAFGDGLTLENPLGYFSGDFDFYADWVQINGEKPSILLYEKGKKTPTVSSDWNTVLSEYDSYLAETIDAVSSDSVVYSIRSELLSLYVDGTEKECPVELVDGFTPCKLSYDNGKVYMLLSEPSEAETKKLYSLIVYENENFSESLISLGNSLSVDGVSCYADVKAFTVKDNSVWLSFYYRDDVGSDTSPSHKTDDPYNPNGDYINLVYSYTLGGDDSECYEAPGLFNFVSDSLNSIYQYAFITDFAISGTNVYATVKVNPNGNSLCTRSLNEIDTFLYFGALIKIDSTKIGTAGYIPESLMSYNDNNTKTDISVYYSGSMTYYEYAYMGVSSHRDSTMLAGPTKILAIKEEELVLVDEGAYIWTSKNTGYHTNVNRIVVFDLAKSSVKYVCPIKQSDAGFSEKIIKSGTLPGFENFSTSVYSLF